jgi:hypothetical protein
VASTVRVRADGCGPRTELGTGTSIPDGLVVTAANVVAGADRVEIVDRSGTTIAAEVVFFDPDLDVAALGPSTDIAGSVVLRDEVGREGEGGLVALISPDGTAEPVVVEVLQRVVIRTTDISRDQPVERPGLRIDVNVEPGDSGAMVHLPAEVSASCGAAARNRRIERGRSISRSNCSMPPHVAGSSTASMSAPASDASRLLGAVGPALRDRRHLDRVRSGARGVVSSGQGAPSTRSRYALRNVPAGSSLRRQVWNVSHSG